MKVKGVNLGNWLVLEKWMSPALFAGTTAEDEFVLTVLNGLDGEVESRVSDEEKRNIYRELEEVQLDAWNSGSGYFYWSYKLLTDTVNDPGWIGWDSWDFGRCADFGWFPEV